MNKKQRVLDCIDGKPIDKVPFSFWHHYSGADNYGDSCVHAHRQIYEAADMDFIKTATVTILCLLKSVYRDRKTGAMLYRHPVIRSGFRSRSILSAGCVMQSMMRHAYFM